MNQRIKKLWTTALTDGSYTQGRRAMRSTDGHEGEPWHCCLGVLCDLYDKENPDAKIWETSFKGIISIDTKTDQLPYSVMLWAGLIETTPRLMNNFETYKMSELNDDHAMSFEEIAYRIEKQY